jgi:hypothetical protein
MAEEAAVVNEPVAADATPTESTPVETQSTEVADEQAIADKAVADSLIETDGEVTENVSEEPAEETDEQPQPKGAEERKQQLNNEIRDLVSKRNALREEVQRANAEVYQPATEEELQEQGLSPEMAAIEAMKQEREMERYNTQVAEAQLTLGSEAQTALRDFPMFDPSSPEYKPEIAARADEILGSSLIFDQNSGQVIGSNVSPYKLYQSFAEAAQVSAQAGQIKGQKATETMLKNSDSVSNAAPAKSTESDNFLKGLTGK